AGGRASHSVAPTVTPTATQLPESSRHIGHDAGSKRKVDDDPATRVMREINSMHDSTSVSDKADEYGKRLKPDPETESTLAGISKTMSVTDSEAISNYNAAFTLLKENPLEQRLDVQLPYEKFVQLDAAFSELKSAEGISDNQKYPSLTYNSLTQTVTVVTAPSGIHEAAARWIDLGMWQYVNDYLSTRSPDTLQNIRPIGSTTMHFSGLYGRSRKEPDGGFVHAPVDSEGKVTIVYEVGYSDAYSKLLDDKDIWIHGKGVNVFVLMSFKETPRFAYPATPSYRDITDSRAERAAMSRIMGRTAQLNVEQGYYGPLRYRDHVWAGELKEVFIEVWRQDTNSRFYLIEEGFSLANEDLPSTLGIRISDFYPQDIWEASNIADGTVPFNSSSFLGSLRHDISMAAQNRFEGFLFEKLRLL
ncbi:hypothetical protein V1508DRAFT_348590, partial [Lipomyces doorenjongii]|uniref:uncharacterized protein n=1 Tax=Lipomyces doorenjongii TaxID=383834 RepID=UPI0034CE1E6A